MTIIFFLLVISILLYLDVIMVKAGNKTDEYNGYMAVLAIAISILSSILFYHFTH